MEYLVSFFQAFWDLVKTSLSWALDGILYVLKASFYFVVDGLLTAVVAIVGSLDVGTIATNAAASWGALPPQLIYVINAVGLPTGLSMIFYAIVLRMALNLIPAAFTRI